MLQHVQEYLEVKVQVSYTPQITLGKGLALTWPHKHQHPFSTSHPSSFTPFLPLRSAGARVSLQHMAAAPKAEQLPSSPAGWRRDRPAGFRVLNYPLDVIKL